MIYHFFCPSQLKKRARDALIGLAISISGCGYGFQNSAQSPLFIKAGIKSIYIDPLVNNTYKPGVENVVFNNLVRSIVSHGRVKLVKVPGDADAVLSGLILNASYVGSAGVQVTSLKPAIADLPTAPYVVNTEYMANLSCYFSLDRRAPRPGEKRQIWTSSFTRTKPFPGANQLDVPGTTSPLINESEFDRALFDLARSMMDDVHESMLAMF